MISVRNDTNDEQVVNEVINERCYDKFIKLNKDDVWLDIGGHIGTFCISIADKVKEVRSYEPIKENYQQLRKNVKLNLIDNIETYNRAVAKNNRKTTIYLSDTNTGMHSLTKKSGRKRILRTIGINNILKGVNCIKIDAEGAEYEIITAIKDWSKIDQIVLEFHADMLKDYEKKYREIYDILIKEFRNITCSNNVFKHPTIIIYARRN